MNINDRIFEKSSVGGIWLTALRIIEFAAEAGRILIIYHFISPKDFGLMGIAVLYSTLLNQLSTTGFQEALIYKQDTTSHVLNSAWTFNLFRSGILFLALFCAAPFLADFVESSHAAPVIQAISVGFVIGAFANIKLVNLQKNLHFRKVFIYKTISLFSNVILSIVLAIILRNVWALVGARLLSNLINCVVSYVIIPHKPSLRFNRDELSELWHFGKWIFVLALIQLATRYGGDFFISKYLGAIMLAYYQMAFRVSFQFIVKISDVINQISFPAFSMMQQDIERLKQAYLKILKLSLLIAAPFCGILLVLAPDIIILCFTPDWLPTIPVIQVLCILSLSNAIGSSRVSLYRATGNPGINTWIQLFRLVSLIIVIYPFAKLWGITGVAWAMVLTGVLQHPIALHLVNTIIRTTWTELLGVISYNILALVIMATGMVLLRNSLFMDLSPDTHGFIFLLVLAGIIFYALSLLLFDRFFDTRYLAIAVEQWTLLKKKLFTQNPISKRQN